MAAGRLRGPRGAQRCWNLSATRSTRPRLAAAVQSGREVGTFLAVHSSFDTGAEWLIALGCVVRHADRTQRRLQQSNTELLAVQEDLRRLIDRDPLTALSNRRALPEVFRAVQPQGATLVFFDLDGFKRINDEHGHSAGDDCLKRFAAALLDLFRRRTPSSSTVETSSWSWPPA